MMSYEPAITPESLAAHKAWLAKTNADIHVSPLVRSCNRHVNCDKAEEEVMQRRGIRRDQITVNFHCYDNDCEICFGR